jgi:hypothetical protein
LRVDEALATAALSLRPTLANHTCKQRGFGYFGDKLPGTTLPHLIEHIAIDLLVAEAATGSGAAAGSGSAAGGAATGGREAGAGDSALLPIAGHNTGPVAGSVAGTTSWVDRERGIMRVRISCDGGDAKASSAARTAIIRAVELVNSLFAQRI